jgi:hypothetical protein
LDFYIKEVAKLDAKILEKQEKIMAEESSSSCFVTFESNDKAVRAINEFSFLKIPFVSGALITVNHPLADGGKEVYWFFIDLFNFLGRIFRFSPQFIFYDESWQLQLLCTCSLCGQLLWPSLEPFLPCRI